MRAPSAVIASSSSLALALGLAAGPLAGCATVADHLERGRLHAACEAEFDEEGGVGLVNRWLEEHLVLDVAPWSAAEVAGRLGGPVRGYGEDVVVARVTMRLGAELARDDDDDFEPAVRVTSGTSSVRALLSRMDPFVVDAGPRLPPGPLDPHDLLPAPLPGDAPPVHHASSGGVLQAFADLVTGVGEAVGTLAMLPVGIMVGIVKGVGDAFDALLGGSTHGFSSPLPPSSSSSMPGDEIYAPPGSAAAAGDVRIVTRPPPPRPSPLDALLEEPEWTALAQKRRDEYERARAAVDAARADRVTRANALADALGCKSGEDGRVVSCLYVLDKDGAWLDLSPGGACAVNAVARHLEMPALLPPSPLAPAAAAAGAGAARAADADAAGADHEGAGPSPPPVIALDEGAPAWARRTPQLAPSLQSLPSPRKKSAAATTATAGTAGAAEATALACELKWKRSNVREADGGPPDVVVRLTAGHDTPRGILLALGPVKKSARFVAPLALSAGERFRISVASAASGSSRSLGGGVVDVDGTVPVVVKSPLWTCTCAPADEVGAAAARADASLAALAAALSSSSSPKIGRARQEARQALVTLAAWRGWADADVRAALARLAALDPAEAADRP